MKCLHNGSALNERSFLLTPRGRPKPDVTKVRVRIRLSLEVIAHFNASGDGWQTRIDAALRQFIAKHPGSH